MSLLRGEGWVTGGYGNVPDVTNSDICMKIYKICIVKNPNQTSMSQGSTFFGILNPAEISQGSLKDHKLY